MYDLFYNPECSDEPYAIGEENRECLHRGLGEPILASIIVGGALTGVSAAIGLFTNRKRGRQKQASTQIVNEAEPLLQQNLSAWEQSDKTVSTQQQALANFDAVWQTVRTECSNPQLGPPGQWCIDDRKPGGKHDWFRRYRDPIASAEANPDPTLTERVLPSQLADMDQDTLMGILGIGLVIGAALMGGKDRG